MKTIKKVTGILITVMLLGGTFYQLFSNRIEKKAELKGLTEFGAIVPVKVITAVRKKVVREITEYGTFQPRHEFNVVAKTRGNVVEVFVQTGDRVNTGQQLAIIENELLGDKLELARLNLENTKNDMERFENLARADAVTKRQLEAVKLNYQNALNTLAELNKEKRHTTISAPVEGFITSRQIEAGSFLVPGTPVFGISAHNKLLFGVQMAESDVVKVKRGDAVVIKTSVFPEELNGYVDQIAVKNSLSGRYNVLIDGFNPGFQLKPGMSGMATFQLSFENETMIIPRKCVTGSILDARVFLLSGDSVKLQPIRVSRLNENQIIVHSGISAGDKVVAEGQMNLQDNAKVRIMNE